MADEIRTSHQPGTHTPGADLAAGADVEATITPGRAPTAADPQDPRFAREQIEKTRARMSETIDEIEEVLVRKKEQLQDRLDVLAPVRERPLASAGVVFGAGLLLGLITGGGDDEPRRASGGHDEDVEERAETWERRARRLLRVAREQEEELESLSGRRGKRLAAWDAEEKEHGSDSSRFGDAADEITDRLTGLATDAIHALFGTGSAKA